MKIVIASLCLFIALKSQAQIADTSGIPLGGSSASSSEHKIYNVNPWVSTAITIGGAAYGLGMLPSIQSKPKITSAEFADLNPSLIRGFDSWVLNQTVGNLKQIERNSGYLQAACALLPLSLFIDSKVSKRWYDILLMYLEVNAVSGAFYMSPLGPLFQSKNRPIVYYTNIAEADKNSGANRNSFYSGHTAAATSDMYFLAKVYCDYHPELGNDKFLIFGAATIPPLIMAYLRIRALDHFPSDILVGYGMGAICGILIPEIHRIADKNVSLGAYSSPQSTGLALTLKLE